MSTITTLYNADGTPALYIAGDKHFKTKTEALVYVNKDRFSARADAFINSREWNRGRDTVARNVVLNFLAFEELSASETIEVDEAV